MYGMAKPLAAHSCNQWLFQRRSCSEFAKKKLSVIMDTIEPEFTKHFTVAPPTETLMCGHDAIKSVDATGCDTVDSPAELRVCNSAALKKWLIAWYCEQKN